MIQRSKRVIETKILVGGGRVGTTMCFKFKSSSRIVTVFLNERLTNKYIKTIRPGDVVTFICQSDHNMIDTVKDIFMIKMLNHKDRMRNDKHST